MGMRDLNRYIKAMRTGFYDPNEDIDYEHKNKDNESSVNGNEINKNSEIGEEKIDNQINTKSDENADIIEIKEKDEKKEKLLEKNEEEEKEILKGEDEENKEDKKNDDNPNENKKIDEEKLLIE